MTGASRAQRGTRPSEEWSVARECIVQKKKKRKRKKEKETTFEEWSVAPVFTTTTLLLLLYYCFLPCRCRSQRSAHHSAEWFVAPEYTARTGTCTLRGRGSPPSSTCHTSCTYFFFVFYLKFYFDYVIHFHYVMG